MAQKRRRTRRVRYEFKPDPKGVNLLKVLRWTRLQQLQFLQWALYSLLCLLLLIVQDVIMSTFRLSGATTDLAVCAILLIGIHEGAERGGLFAMIASMIYYFSGSAPGPYVIAAVVFLTIAATLFRQSYWQQGFSSTMLCACLAMVLYEIILFAIGIFLGLTIWSRFPVFVLTGILSCIVMLPLYPLVNRIGKIGGNTWKE